jgi:hypothetical protein
MYEKKGGGCSNLQCSKFLKTTNLMVLKNNPQAFKDLTHEA